MPNRYVCDVLKEIRTAVKVGRIDMIRGLVEEIQTMVNRMEAKLSDYANIGYDLSEAHDFRRKLKTMRVEAQALDDKIRDDADNSKDNEYVRDLFEG